MTKATATSWAVAGKRPSTKDDYTLLNWAAAGPGDEPDLAGRVWAGVPSTPQLASVPGPGRPPWVTFASYAAAGQYLMAVTVTDQTRDRDAAGRRAVAIRHVAVPFREAAEGRLGYQAIYHAMPPFAELRDRDAAAPLRLEIGDAGEPLARGLRADATFDRAASLAALLLSGDVLITMLESDDSEPGERLAEFDRILALLPYGLRAGVCVASWHDRPNDRGIAPWHSAATEHGVAKERGIVFQLAYGRFATRGEWAVPYDGPAPPPGDTLAAGYLAELHAVRDDPEFGLPVLLDHLAAHRAPLSLGDASEALAILSALRRPSLLAEAIADGRTPSVERAARVRRYARDRLDQAASDQIEAYLFRLDSDDAEREVNAGWSERSAQVAARAALDELLAGREQARERLYGYAAKHAEADRFLAAIAEGRTNEGAELSPEQIAQTLIALASPGSGDQRDQRDQRDERDERGQQSLLRDAVLARPDLARWLLRLSARRAAEPLAWLGWLDPEAADAPPWLRRYAGLAATGRRARPVELPSGAGNIEARDDISEDLSLIAAHVLIADGSLHSLTDEWWQALFALAGPSEESPAGHRARADLLFLAGAVKPGPDLPLNLRVDSLRLYCGLSPLGLPLGAGSRTVREYLDGLFELWHALSRDSGDVAAQASRLVVRVAGEAGEVGGSIQLADGVAEVLLAAMSDDRIPAGEVVTAVGSALAASPVLIDHPALSADWWRRVERYLPDIRTPRARLVAAMRRGTASPVEIAELSGRAAADGLSAAELASITGDFVARLPPDAAWKMLLVTDGIGYLSGPPRDPRDPREHDDYIAELAQHLGISSEPLRGLGRWRRRP